MASIGERLAAFLAGKTPKNTPMKVETDIAIITDKRFKLAGKNVLTPKTISPDKTSPATPPKSESITDSDMN